MRKKLLSLQIHTFTENLIIYIVLKVVVILTFFLLEDLKSQDFKDLYELKIY